MSRFESENVIRLFDFYLATMFVLGFARRYTIYWDILRFAVSLRGRWPRLLERVGQHQGVLVTREVLRPLGVALALTLTQMVCSRLIWPHALLEVDEVAASWWRLAVLTAAAAPMIGVDVYFILRVGAFDRMDTEKYLDQAEHWLGTWKAPVIRTLTLGYLNPHRMVDTEVKKGLELLGRTVSWTAWWVSVQVGCRVVCGLVIWLMWALASGG